MPPKRRAMAHAQGQSRAHPSDAAVAAPSPSPPLPPPPLPQPRSRPRRPCAHPRGKRRNPLGGSASYNHRSRFTALKRRLHAQRRAALDRWAAATLTADGAGSHRARQATALVREMDGLSLRMDAAMRGRQFGLAGALRRRLRGRRYRLQRTLSTAAPAPSSELPETDSHTSTSPSSSGSAAGFVECGGETREGEGGRVSRRDGGHAPHTAPPPLFYVNHYPATVLLRLGEHPMAAVVDLRTGRYPRRVDPAVVRAFLQAGTALAMEDAAREDGRLARWCGEAWAAGPPEQGGRGLSECGAQVEGVPARGRHPLFVAHYCRNMVTDFLDDMAFTTLQALYLEQRDLQAKQPLQFKARQRYVVGFSEVTKHLRAGRVRLVLLAADVEVADPQRPAPAAPGHAKPSAGAAAGAGPRRRKFQTLDEAIDGVVALCTGSNSSDPTSAPSLLTCMSRQRLSYALFAKGSRISCVGILRAEKNLELLKALRLLARGLCDAYQRIAPS